MNKPAEAGAMSIDLHLWIGTLEMHYITDLNKLMKTWCHYSIVQQAERQVHIELNY